MSHPNDRYFYAIADFIGVGLAYLFAEQTGCPFPLAVPMCCLILVGVYRLFLKVFM